MDTRRLLTTILIAGAIMLAFPYIMRLWNGDKPPVAPGAAPELFPAIVAANAAAEQGAKPETLELGDPSGKSKDKLAVTIDNVTAGIDRVELNVNDYSQDQNSRQHGPPQPLVLLQNIAGQPRPYATLSVHYTPESGLTQVVDFYASQFVWKMQRDPGNAYQANLIATINFPDGKPALRITKMFRVDPNSYEMYISHDVENLSGKAMKVQIDQMAATDLPLDPTQIDDRFYHAAGLNTDKKILEPERFNLGHAELLRFDATNMKSAGSFIGKDPLEWIASSQRFFVAITRPLPETGAPAPLMLSETQRLTVATHVAAADIIRLEAKPEAVDCIGGIRLTGNALDVPPNRPIGMPLSVYFGPKRQDILEGNHAAPVDSPAYNYWVFQYVKIIQLSSAGCRIYQYCAIDALAYYMLKFLDLLKASIAFGNYGIAIIILVFLVKAALHPLTRAAQINMATMGKKMKDIQPLIEANKKKYAKDKQKQNEEMMRIYKEKNVNPAGGLMGCLPMALQTPIWIAVWMGLQTDIDLRHATFIPGWINDLSAPDRTIIFSAPIHVPLLSGMMGPITALNILPLLLGIVVFFQMKVQTASQPKPTDPQQASMQKMSSYMVLIFPLFLYNRPSAINLYYFASTLGGLVDTYFVRKSLKKKGILPTNAQVLPTHEERD